MPNSIKKSELTVFSSVLNPNHCRQVFKSPIRSPNNWRFVVVFFCQQLYKVNGVLLQYRSVKRKMRCVNLIRCQIWLRPMLSNANLNLRAACVSALLPCQHQQFVPQTCQLCRAQIAWRSVSRPVGRFVAFHLCRHITRNTRWSLFQRSVYHPFWWSYDTRRLQKRHNNKVLSAQTELMW